MNAKPDVRTMESEMAKERQLALGSHRCDVCGAALEDGRQKRCRGECTTVHRRAYYRASRYKTALDEELSRKRLCLLCGGLPSSMNQDFCDACAASGAGRCIAVPVATTD